MYILYVSLMRWNPNSNPYSNNIIINESIFRYAIMIHDTYDFLFVLERTLYYVQRYLWFNKLILHIERLTDNIPVLGYVSRKIILSYVPENQEIHLSGILVY